MENEKGFKRVTLELTEEEAGFVEQAGIGRHDGRARALRFALTHGMDALRRFHSRIEKTGSGCWLWTGATVQNGAGVTRDPATGRMATAARVAWEVAHGPVPVGKIVLPNGRCDNPACVNPTHHKVGTQKNRVQAKKKAITK